MTWGELKQQILKMDDEQLGRHFTVHEISTGFYAMPDRVKKARANLYSIHEDGDRLFNKTDGLRYREMHADQFEEDPDVHLAIQKGEFVLEID